MSIVRFYESQLNCPIHALPILLVLKRAGKVAFPLEKIKKEPLGGSKCAAYEGLTSHMGVLHVR